MADAVSGSQSLVYSIRRSAYLCNLVLTHVLVKSSLDVESLSAKSSVRVSHGHGPPHRLLDMLGE